MLIKKPMWQQSLKTTVHLAKPPKTTSKSFSARGGSSGGGNSSSGGSSAQNIKEGNTAFVKVTQVDGSHVRQCDSTQRL